MAERREVGPRSREIVAREHRHLAPGSQFLLHNTGVPNFGGPIVTGGGLVCIGAALDNYLRAVAPLAGETLPTLHPSWTSHARITKLSQLHPPNRGGPRRAAGAKTLAGNRHPAEAVIFNARLRFCLKQQSCGCERRSERVR